MQVYPIEGEIVSLSLSLSGAELIMKTADNFSVESNHNDISLKSEGRRFCNLELDMGVGDLTLKSCIEEQSRLDYGIGKTKLTLLGSCEEHQIEIGKSIGEAMHEGKSMLDDSVYGTGNNRIEIDGGIGAINIAFSEDEIQKAFGYHRHKEKYI